MITTLWIGYVADGLSGFECNGPAGVRNVAAADPDAARARYTALYITPMFEVIGEGLVALS